MLYLMHHDGFISFDFSKSLMQISNTLSCTFWNRNNLFEYTKCLQRYLISMCKRKQKWQIISSCTENITIVFVYNVCSKMAIAGLSLHFVSSIDIACNFILLAFAKCVLSVMCNRPYWIDTRARMVLKCPYSQFTKQISFESIVKVLSNTKRFTLSKLLFNNQKLQAIQKYYLRCHAVEMKNSLGRKFTTPFCLTLFLYFLCSIQCRLLFYAFY